MKTIYFCYLDNPVSGGKHFLHFKSKSSRLSYLSNKVKFTGQQNFQEHAFIGELVVPFPISKIRLVNYLYFTIDGSSQDIYCYHILRSEYKTATSSTIFLKLDAFTTYQFSLTFKPSFVERCHVDRWESSGVPAKEITTEKFGDYDKTIIKTQSAPINDGCYIYASVNPLGKLTYRPTTGSGGGGGGSTDGTGCGDPDLGIPSPNGFLFIKGYEGLAQYSYNIGDGVLTIGYGCTDAYDGENYQTLKANEPVTDELASKVMANSLVENYGIPLINQLESDGVTVTVNEFDGLLSFVYNAGLGSLINSSFYQSIKNGDKSTACQQWLTTNILAGSQFEEGLRARRQAEVNIFQNAQYELRTIVIYGQGGSVVGSMEANESSVPELIANTCNQSGFVNQVTQDELGNVWQFPVGGTVSSTYPNYPDGTYHGAIDIAGNEGKKIRSSGTGVVYYVGTDTSSGYGNYVIIQMTNGTRHWFAHMKTTPYVTEGQSVTPQTVLGIVGSTGNSTGPHVHWEIRVSPYAYDQTCMINPSPSTNLYDVIQGVGD